MTIAGDPIGHHLRHGTGGREESFRGRKVLSLAQPYVHQMAVAVDGPIQVTPSAIILDVRLIDVPALANDTSAALAQLARNQRSEFRLPLPHSLMREHEATLEEHRGQVAQA